MMIEAVIMTLIYICLVVLVVYVVFWVIEQLGVPIPAQVQKIVWIIVALICLLLLVRMLLPALKIASIVVPMVVSYG
jgi:hypothetical protein